MDFSNIGSTDAGAALNPDVVVAPLPDGARTPSGDPTDPTDPADLDAALRRELAGVRSVNEAVEGLIHTLETAKGNMATVVATVADTTALLNTWTRILSQTEHNQRLILAPDWLGSTNDLLVLEAEAARRRAAADEAQRRLRLAEEMERQRRDLAGLEPGPQQRGARSGFTTRGRAGARGSVSSRGVGGRANSSDGPPRSLSRSASVGRGQTRGTGRSRIGGVLRG